MRNILTLVPGKKRKLSPLSVTHPELVKQADGWDPSTFYAGSNEKVSWICPKKHSFQTRISHRASGKSRCPICSNKQVLSGFNDLKTLFPEIAAEANGWDPELTLAGSHSKKKWLCPMNHSYEAIVVSRTLLKTFCPVCANRKILSGFNDLATTHPFLIKEVDGWDPTEFFAGTNQKKKWRCPQGHSYDAAISSRAKVNGSNCPICANQKILTGFNDLETTHREIAAEASGWDPKLVLGGSNSKKRWKCPLGHEYVSTVSGRTSTGKGCAVCANQKILIGFNDLSTTYPEIAKEASGWDPRLITAGSHKRLRWMCAFGHKWIAEVSSRTSQGTNCPSCAQFGFDLNKAAFLYFLSNPLWNMLQIGITNVPDDRLSKHSRLGWELVELRGPMDGHLAKQWETAILRMLKAKGADLSNSKIAGKFDGYSEAWSKSTFEVKSIKELMKLTEEFEDN